MAQEVQQFGRPGGLAAKPAGRMGFASWSGMEAKPQEKREGVRGGSDLPQALLIALADEPSRRILISAIDHGKTVEEMSAEQGLPLSTCYRKVRFLLDEGLLLLERMVVTRTGKRYAIYRSSILEAQIDFHHGSLEVHVTPNPDMLEKLRGRWFSSGSQQHDYDGHISVFE